MNKNFSFGYSPFFILTIILIFSINATSQGNWYSYRSLDDTFIAEFPNERVRYNQKEIITALGKLNHEVFYLETEEKTDPNFLYSISRVFYPDSTFHKDSTDLVFEFLESASQSLVESTGCKELYHDIDESTSEPTLIMRLQDNKTNASIKVKMMIIDQWLYTLQVYTYHDNILNDQIDRFIKSFQTVK